MLVHKMATQVTMYSTKAVSATYAIVHIPQADFVALVAFDRWIGYH